MANFYSKVRELVSGLNNRNQDELYQGMFDTAAAGMITIGTHGSIIACNPALCRIFGYDSDELIGTGIERLMPQAYARHHQEYINNYMETGSATVMGRGREVRALHKNGSEFLVHLSVSEMTLAGARCFTGVVHELSATQESDRRRYYDQAWMGNVLDQTPAALLVKDMTGRYLLLNSRAETLFDTRAEQAVGHTDRQLFDPHWASIEERTDNEVISAGVPRIFVQPILQQGVSRNLLVSKNLLLDSAGAPMGLVSLSVDISSISAFRKQDKEEETGILDLLPQGLALVSQDGAIIKANQMYAQRFGMTSRAVVNCNLTVVETEGVVRAFNKLLSSDMQETQVNDPGLAPLRMQRCCLNGEEIVVLTSELPPSSYQAQSEVTESPSLSLADNAQFIASLSHELRTPLNSVIGFSQILKSDSLLPEQHEAVDMIERAGKHLVALVDQVLDLIKLDGAVDDVLAEPFSLLPVIEECIELCSSLPQCSAVSIYFNSDISAPWACGDRTRVKQIVLNLLTNALKYNRANHPVCVEIQQLTETSLRINVKDHGVGVAHDRQHKIFDPFERLGAECSAIEGNGLGLAICRQLAERMNGQMNFVSVEGEGSSFWLDLPVAQPLYSTRVYDRYEKATRVALDDAYRVLYIEDNILNARFVELGLEPYENVNVTVAYSGKEGIDKAVEHLPDVILLDMRLPDIHGLELLKQLRNLPELKHAKIYGVSADVTPAQLDAVEDAGLDGYMTKPLDLHQLNELICH